MQDYDPNGVDEIRAAFDAAETVPPLGADDQTDNAGDAPHDDRPPPDVEPDQPPGPEHEARHLEANDHGNGRRLIAYFGEDLAHVPRMSWFVWGGTHWRADEDEILVRRRAQAIGAKIHAEALLLELEPYELEAVQLADETRTEFRKLQSAKGKGKELSGEELSRLDTLREISEVAAGHRKALAARRREHRKHAKQTGNTSRIKSMLVEATTYAHCPMEKLDANPLKLNCESGILTFTQDEDPHAAAWGDARRSWRVEQSPHDRAQFMTKLVRAPYDPGAKCPIFLEFLDTIMPDPEIRAFLKCWFGYNLTGLVNEQKLAFFYGMGRNGKSTLVDVIGKIMAEYSATLNIESITGSDSAKGSEATPDLVCLPGARFVRTSEPEQGQKLRESFIKKITGGEPFKIRRMHKEFVEIYPEFKITIGGNHRPEIRGGDDGIWRRMMLVPFEVQIAKENVDADLPNKLWAERAGILTWMVEGALEYLTTGLPEPEAIRAATEDYRTESDPFREFLQEECEITGLEGDQELCRVVHDAFNAWQISRGESGMGKRWISNRFLERVGAVPGKEGQTFGRHKKSDWFYIGLKLPAVAKDRIEQFQAQIQQAAARRG